MALSLPDFILSLGLAAILGSGIGLERQWRQRLAGLRTNALVALGAAAFSMLGLKYEGGGSELRIAAQVVSGIGFLGGGVILREGLNVRGLNTAATLWCSAAVGVLCGMGWLAEGAFTALFVVTLNMILRPLAERINRQQSEGTTEVETTYRLEAVCSDKEEAHIRALIMQSVTPSALIMKGIESSDIEDSNKVRIQAELAAIGRVDRLVEQIASRLSIEPTIASVSWRATETTD